MEENQQNLGATPPAEIGGAPAMEAMLQTSVKADHEQQLGGMDMDVEADKPTATSSSSTFTFAGAGDATTATVVPDSLAVAAPATARLSGGHMEEELRPVLSSTTTTTSMSCTSMPVR